MLPESFMTSPNEATRSSLIEDAVVAIVVGALFCTSYDMFYVALLCLVVWRDVLQSTFVVWPFCCSLLHF